MQQQHCTTVWLQQSKCLSSRHPATPNSLDSGTLCCCSTPHQAWEAAWRGVPSEAGCWGMEMNDMFLGRMLAVLAARVLP